MQEALIRDSIRATQLERLPALLRWKPERFETLPKAGSIARLMSLVMLAEHTYTSELA